MKKAVLQIVAIVAVVFFSSSGAVAQSNEKYKQQIEKINKEMSAAMVAGDDAKTMSFYAEDVISMPNFDKMLEGKEALRKSNEAMHHAGWKVKSFNPVTLKVMSAENTITEIGKFKISFAMEGMPQPIEDSGSYVTIWEKQPDGKLLIKVEIWNSDTNPLDKKM